MGAVTRDEDDDETGRGAARTGTRPMAVLRTEPAVWSRTMSGPLSDAELLFYDTHGYLALPGFVDRRHAAILHGAAEVLRARASLEDAPLTADRDPDADAIRVVHGVHDDGLHFAALMAHPGIVGAVRQILAEDAYVLESRLDFRSAFDARGLPWRADFVRWRNHAGLPAMRALSVRLFLSAHRACNAPVMVIPGSHRTSVPHVEEPSGVWSTNRDAVRALERTHGIDVITGGPGTVLIADTNLLYASGDNPSPLDRVTFFCGFNAVSNTPV